MGYLKGPKKDEAARLAYQLRRRGHTWLDTALQLQRAGYYLHDGEPTTGFARRLVDHYVSTQGAGRHEGSEGAAPAQGEGDEQAPVVAKPARREFASVDKRRHALRRYLGTTWEPEQFYYKPPRQERLVAAIGDLHGNPDPVLTRDLVRSKPDLTIIAGDILDQQWASAHQPMTRQELRHQRRREHRDESASVRVFFETLADEIEGGEFELFLGNHDTWALRSALDALPAGLLELFSDPMDLLLFNLGPRFRKVGHPITYHFPNGDVQPTAMENEFIYVCGDVLLSHLNKVSGVTETAVSKLYRQWHTAWSDTLGLNDVRMLVQFHAHSRSMKTVRGGHMLLIEPGMFASVETEAYKHSYAGKWGPGVQGFARFVQYLDGATWRTDLGSLELVAPRITQRARAGGQP